MVSTVVISKERITDFDTAQRAIDKITDDINAKELANVFSGGNIIHDIPITTSTTIIKHGLGREYVGYIVVKTSTRIDVYDDEASNPRKSTEIHLVVSAATTMSLLVF